MSSSSHTAPRMNPIMSDTSLSGIAKKALKRSWSPQSDTDSMTVDAEANTMIMNRNSRKYVQSVHKFPKFVGPSRQKGRTPEPPQRQFFTEQRIEESIVAPVKAQAPKALKSLWKNLSSFALLKVSFCDDPDDARTVLLHVRGCELLVTAAKRRIINLVRRDIARYNLDSLRADRDAMELDVLMRLESGAQTRSGGRNGNVLDALGIDVSELGENEEEEEADGLWIESLCPGGQLARVLGHAARCGVAIRRVGNVHYQANGDDGSGTVPIKSRSGLERWYKRSVLQHKSNEDFFEDEVLGGTPQLFSTGDGVVTIIVTVGIFGRADLSNVDALNGIATASTCPRNMRTGLPVRHDLRSAWHERRQLRASTLPNAATPIFESAITAFLHQFVSEKCSVTVSAVKSLDDPCRCRSEAVDLARFAQFVKKGEENTDDKAAVQMLPTKFLTSAGTAPDIIELLSDDEDDECCGQKSESQMQIDKTDDCKESRKRRNPPCNDDILQASQSKHQPASVDTKSQVCGVSMRDTAAEASPLRSGTNCRSKRKIPEKRDEAPVSTKTAISRKKPASKMEEKAIVTKKRKARRRSIQETSSAASAGATPSNQDEISQRASQCDVHHGSASKCKASRLASRSSCSWTANMSDPLFRRGASQNLATDDVATPDTLSEPTPQNEKEGGGTEKAPASQKLDFVRQMAYLESSVGAISSRDAGVFARALRRVSNLDARDSKGKRVMEHVHEASCRATRELNGCHPSAEARLKETVKDMRRKKTALSICIAVKEAIDRARNLHEERHDWESVEFTPVSVQHLVLNPETDNDGYSDEVFYHVTINGAKYSLGTPGKAPLGGKDDVTFTKEAEKFCISYKRMESTKYMSREVWIDLMKGNETHNKIIARFSFPFENLTKVPPRGEGFVEANPMEPSPFLVKGTMVLCAHRVGRSYALQADIHRIAGSIQSFKSDVPSSEWDVDTCFPEHSLLHAAVYVRCPRLVGLLLKQRGNVPKEDDKKSSPRALAQELYRQLDATASSDLRQRRRDIVREFERMTTEESTT